jgi:hypothetical protein
VPSFARASYRLRKRVERSYEHAHRFGAERTKQTFERLQKVSMEASDWITCTATLTFVAQPTYPGSRTLIPPTRHFELLTHASEATDPRRRQVGRELDRLGGRAVIVAVHGAHGSGYAHTHWYIGSEESLSVDTLRPVVDRHVEHCQLAPDDRHGSDAISVESDPTTDWFPDQLAYVMDHRPGMKAYREAKDDDETLLRAETAGLPAESTCRRRLGAVLDGVRADAVKIDWHD